MIQWQTEEIKSRRPYRFDFPVKTTKIVTDIIEAVIEHYECSMKEIQGPSSKRNLVEARMVIAYLLRPYQTQIRTSIVINRDRSVIPYYLKKIGEMIDTKDKISQRIDIISEKLLIAERSGS